MKTESEDVVRRYTTDLVAIQSQIDFHRKRSLVLVRELPEINELLEKLAIEPLPLEPGSPSNEIDIGTLSQLIPHVRRLRPALEQLQLNGIDAIVDAGEEIQHRSLEWGDLEDEQEAVEWAHWFLDTLGDELAGKSTAELERYADSAIGSGADFEREPMVTWIRRGAEDARIEFWNRRNGDIYDLLERFEEIELFVDTGKSSSPIGVLRQAFIAMMASFDAAIFDLVKIALRKNFFELAKHLDKKLAIDNIEAFSVWEEVRDAIIEAQLKKRYVKDLIDLMDQSWNVFEKADKQRIDLKRIREQIYRRNIHLHNRGHADKQYVEALNIDRLLIGDFAVISEEYWVRARAVTESLVRWIAGWTDNR